MQNIDFLPTDYRSVRLQRTNWYWCVVVVGLLGLPFSVVTVYQYQIDVGIETELAKIEPEYLDAIEAMKHLQELQKQAKETNANADLVAYLGHRYPASRILATVFEPLPDSVTLDELLVQSEPFASAPSPSGLTRRRAKIRAEAVEEKPQGPLALVDLEELRSKHSAMRIVITLSGKTRRSDMLHKYVSELGQSDLIAKAEVRSIETASEKPGSKTGWRLSEFTVRIVLHAGHGQTDGASEIVKQPVVPQSLAQRRQRR